MNTILISYGIKEYDGRLSELKDVFDQIGNVHTVCCAINKVENSDYTSITIESEKHLSSWNYLKFIFSCFRLALKNRNKVDILVVDNMFASIPAILITPILKPKYIIQDVRELYFYEDIKSRTGRLFSRFETKLMKVADLVLCANKQRAEIMYKHYKLDEKPLVFENIRALKGIYDKEEFDKKYINHFNSKVNIVSTGGLSLSRGTDQLVESMKNLSNEFCLYIIGSGTERDYKEINNIINKYELNNIKLINKVPMQELRYIISRCDIGIVHYSKKDLNNKYCASGKVYEYITEGLPIVTTENIPLKEFCDSTGVGIADDSFSTGIKLISKDIDLYKSKVKSYSNKLSIDTYNSEVSKQILNIISFKKKEKDVVDFE